MEEIKNMTPQEALNDIKKFTTVYGVPHENPQGVIIDDSYNPLQKQIEVLQDFITGQRFTLCGVPIEQAIRIIENYKENEMNSLCRMPGVKK